MLIQTNLSAVKASQGTPIEVVEERLKELVSRASRAVNSSLALFKED